MTRAALALGLLVAVAYGLHRAALAAAYGSGRVAGRLDALDEWDLRQGQ